jgi:NAD(P)-dependent dehydrogenase (short-subunit alcohol dehydrogenase family)
VSLSGRNILITGANRGLGAAFVTAALARGAAKIYAGVRDPAEFGARDEATADRVVPITLDLTVPADAEAAALQCPDVDLLISNAGVPCYGAALTLADESAFRHAFEVNVFGPLHLVRAFAPTLRRRDGSGVIMVLSSAALGLSRSSPVYSASKSAGLMLAAAVRAELADVDVTVTASVPGFIATEMSSQLNAPKAPASLVAERTLDGWLAGNATVWPDRFAQLVRDAIGAPMREMLDDPVAAMKKVHAAFASDPAAGS